jgi:hypothetical protein
MMGATQRREWRFFGGSVLGLWRLRRSSRLFHHPVLSSFVLVTGYRNFKDSGGLAIDKILPVSVVSKLGH